MELDFIFNELKLQASVLGGYENIPINELANGYCKAADENNSYLKDVYFSALILRFWYKISKMHNENITLNLEYTDYFNWLVDAIQMACDKDNRAWQANPKLNAQQVINQILATRFVAAAYYDSNLLKNAGKNFTTSLDEPLDGFNEDGNTLGDVIIEEENPALSEDNSDVYYLIQEFLDQHKLIEAIIVDNIAFKDSVKYEKEITKTVGENGKVKKETTYYTSFWPYKVIKEISSIDDKYRNYFKNTYKVSEPAIDAAFKAIEKANSQKKYKYLEAAQNCLRTAYGY